MGLANKLVWKYPSGIEVLQFQTFLIYSGLQNILSYRKLDFFLNLIIICDFLLSAPFFQV